MVKINKLETSIPFYKAPSVEQAFLSDFLPNFKGNLASGKNITNTDLLPRELIGLIVTSVLINICYKEPYTIGQEKFFGFDGVIARQDINSLERGSRTGLFFEQVYVLPGGHSPFLSRLENSLQKKLKKGEQYSSNINLIILTEEDVPGEPLQETIKQLRYEMIIHINALPPQPFHFDLNILRNNDVNDEIKSCKIYLDKLTGIQQSIVTGKSYLIISGIAARTNYNLPLKWRVN